MCVCVFRLQLTYQQGMAVVLVTALLILATAVLGLRGRLMQLFPTHLVLAMVVGLGLFLTLVSGRPGLLTLKFGHCQQLQLLQGGPAVV